MCLSYLFYNLKHWRQSIYHRELAMSLEKAIKKCLKTDIQNKSTKKHMNITYLQECDFYTVGGNLTSFSKELWYWGEGGVGRGGGKGGLMLWNGGVNYFLVIILCGKKDVKSFLGYFPFFICKWSVLSPFIDDLSS